MDQQDSSMGQQNNEPPTNAAIKEISSHDMPDRLSSTSLKDENPQPTSYTKIQEDFEQSNHPPFSTPLTESVKYSSVIIEEEQTETMTECESSPGCDVSSQPLSSVAVCQEVNANPELDNERLEDTEQSLIHISGSSRKARRIGRPISHCNRRVH